jgi:hypothetical protein
MLLSLVYLVMRCLLQALARSGRVDFETGGRAAGPSTSAQGDLAQRSPGRRSAEGTACCSPRRAGSCQKTGGSRSW